MSTPCHNCALNEEFKREVTDGLTELRTNMKSLIGNGQPGRIGILEHKVDRTSTTVNLIIGGLILASALLGVAKIFL